jgi:hypothetical protein
VNRLAVFTRLLPAILCLSSCGYVGPVLPPSPQIPTTISDLNAVERDDQIVVNFTTPARTTDGVAITNFSKIELRIEPEGKIISIDLPLSGDKEDPQPKPIEQRVPVADWAGQHVRITVRTAVKKSDHYSAWSNPLALDIISPLQPPVVHAASSPTGIDLTWDAAEGVHYRVSRQGPVDKQPLELSASVDGGKYIDMTAQYDTEYRYTVTAVKGRAESSPYVVNPFTAIDKFPPGVPTGLTILAGPDAVDLAWQRDTEPDLQGYYVYRSTNGGPFERQGALVNLPTYIDHNVEHGKTYTYKVSAIDKKNNESAQSHTVEAQY